MRSGTSFFDLTIYRKTFTRFWPLWALNLVIWLFILPFNGLIELSNSIGREVNYMHRFARGVGDYATEFGIIFALIFALVVAMAVCSHLYNNRSANFMGMLPARREGQFLSTYLSGLTMLIAPNVVVFLLTLLVEAAGSAVMWEPLLFWLAAMCATEFFFYSFAVCLGQFTGHILALPVYYGIFNAIVVAVYGLLSWVMDRYYFGFTGMGNVQSGFVMWCTPVATFYQMDIDVYSEPVPEGLVDGPATWIVDIEGLWIAGVYAIVAVVLTACALLLYRRRHLETAGDIVSVKVMRPVFKYGVALCAGMFLGFLFDQMFSLSEIGMLIWTVIWGIVGYFIAQMLLDKSIRVFKKWKGAAAVTVVFLMVFAVIGFDITGYETRVPAAEQVQSVTIDGLDGDGYYDTGSYIDGAILTDPEEIADVIALHQAIIEVGEDGEADSEGLYRTYVAFDVTYTLKSGGKMSRSYRMSMGERLLPLVQKLRSSETVRRQAYRLDRVEEWQTQGAKLASVNIESDMQGVWYSDERYGDDAMRLWNAVMADFEAGRIGVYRGASESTQTRLYFYWEKERVTNEPGNALVSYEPDSTKPVAVDTLYVEFAVTEQATETMELLDELLVPDNRYQDDPDDNPLWKSE